ncbi:hypothetical protein LCGC14_3023290, partial [marine sediment metagenome]
YLADHTKDPPIGSLEALLEQGYTAEYALTCPATGKDRRRQYFYHPGRLEDDPETILACDLAGYHRGGRNVLYVDGRLAWLDEAAFAEKLAAPVNAALAAALKKVEGP